MKATVLTLFGILFFFSLGLNAQKKTNKIKKKDRKKYVSVDDR